MSPETSHPRQVHSGSEAVSSPCCPEAGETTGSWSEARLPSPDSWIAGLATTSCWSCWWCGRWFSSLARQENKLAVSARTDCVSGLVSPEEKNEMELLATLAWAASEAELLEIPSVEEVTVPPPRLPRGATRHYSGLTNQQQSIFVTQFSRHPVKLIISPYLILMP